MIDWFLFILPVLLVGSIFLVAIKSKINNKFGRQLARTFCGLFVIAYGINNKIVLLSFLSCVLLFLLLAPKRSIFFKKMIGKEKFSRINGLTIYLSVVMLTLIIFPLWIAGCCLVNLSFADGFASIIGEREKFKLPWNKKKTLEGSLGFIFVSSVSCFLVMSFLSPLSFDKIVLFTLTTSLIASFTESLPIKLDDNISVPLVTGIVLNLLNILF